MLRACHCSPFRWITGNEYTSFSAVYPECFGRAIGFAESMSRGEEALGESDPEQKAKVWAAILRNHHLPSLQERKEEADKAIASPIQINFGFTRADPINVFYQFKTLMLVTLFMFLCIRRHG